MDLLSALSSLNDSSSSSSSSSNSQSDLLVQAFKKSQQPKIDALTSKQKTLETRQVFFNNLNTKISSLLSAIDTFTATNANSKFVTRSITSSDTNVATATVTSDAAPGLNSLKINRLASSDIFISDQVSQSEAFGVTGSKKFKINGKEITVDFGSDRNLTQSEAIQKMANAINSNSDTNVTASMVKDTNSTVRLTLTSKKTGKENSITFSDERSGVLSKLGFDNFNTNSSEDRVSNDNRRSVSDKAKAHFKQSKASNMDADLEINGISISRSSNTIDDVLPGVTLNLLKPQESTDMDLTLTTNINTSAVESLIKPLLDNYNELLRFVKSDKTISRTESTVSSLATNLRTTITQAIATTDNSDPKYLTDIGIKIGSDGTLSIGDKSKLEDYLKSDPEKVANLFTASDGFANRLSGLVSSLSGSDGIIQSRRTSISKQIQSTSDRVKEMQARIDRQAEATRKEYESMLKVYLEAQNQYGTLSSVQSLLYSS